MDSQHIPLIYTAARNGDCEVLAQQLAQGANVNTTNPRGWTPLHAAAYYGQLEAVRILLQHGASVETAIPEDGYRPLHKACERDLVEIVQFLIDSGADQEARTNKKLTPLHIAAGNGQTDVVNYLLGLDVQVEPQSVSGESPLHPAARNGSIDVVSLLVGAGATVDIVNDLGLTPLLVATAEGHVGIVQYLLDHGADLRCRNKLGWTALHISSYRGHTAVLQRLLERPTPGLEDRINADGYRPLHKAAETGHVEIVRRLIDAGAKINADTSNRQTPLYVAVRLNKPGAARELLRRGADVNRPKDNGWTPLHVAVDTGNESMVKLLRSHGADGTREDQTGQTALSLARSLGKQHFVDILSAPLEPDGSFVGDGVSGGTMAVNPLGAATVERASNAWFAHLIHFRDRFYEDHAPTGQARIRIAIIDSGIEPDHLFMSKVHGYRDFTSDAQAKQDLTGHGSTGVHLVCRIIRDPEIYVARVFQRSTGSVEEQSYITQAIEHARTVWKVDIIALASGFNVAHHQMEQAINECNTHHILVFAAAGNEANLGFIQFPARLDSVIGMFSTDAKGKAITSSINPSPSKTKPYNLAVFGENVVAHPGAKPQSGTSMATFVGAAVAGLLLDLCQLPDVQEVIGKDLQVDLRKTRGMSAVLAKMSDGGQEGYQCISPWKLSSSYPRPIHEERRAIASTIMVALDSIWK